MVKEISVIYYSEIADIIAQREESDRKAAEKREKELEEEKRRSLEGQKAVLQQSEKVKIILENIEQNHPEIQASRNHEILFKDESEEMQDNGTTISFLKTRRFILLWGDKTGETQQEKQILTKYQGRKITRFRADLPKEIILWDCKGLQIEVYDGNVNVLSGEQAEDWDSVSSDEFLADQKILFPSLATALTYPIQYKQVLKRNHDYKA